MLEAAGVRFDRGEDGTPDLAREGAHGRSRVLHAGGDRSGAELARALAGAVARTPSIRVLERTRVTRILTGACGVTGAVLERDGRTECLPASDVVLATGGIGGLFLATTNPLSNWGAGLYLAFRAGAVLRDLEFVQFHPTAICPPGHAIGDAALPLASEALRGEGATLVDRHGTRLLAHLPGAELAARDSVSRALWPHVQRGEPIFLDPRTTIGADFPHHFPGIATACHALGIDPLRGPIPVRPAAHYHMGGIATDRDGQSSVPGLWAVGEVASTGLHGANRLASNSLLEAVVFATRTARAISGREARRAGPLRDAGHMPDAEPAGAARAVRRILDEGLGVVRSERGLNRTREALAAMRRDTPANSRRAAMIAIAELITQGALARAESRGAHWRSDAPGLWPGPPLRSLQSRDSHRVDFQSEDPVHEPW
ncbi:L-aspartate oxidase [Salipiger mucosus DSM 16094]|uniref:L-aspartate oxidase n=2 Tax=Salipiger mucosus TaxID=263378 RepID=S9RQU2_9RHOB|nr:L-aspartate oxidase [Salipiger mucosus DSM 16094]